MALSTYSFLSLAVLGTIPSLLWLISYLRNDIHPEPKRVIVKLFFMGFILTPFVAAGELMLQEGIGKLLHTSFDTITSVAAILLLILAAFWEEVAKYLAARSIFHHEREFDELTDAMIYLITVALGFAASENIIILIRALVQNPAQDIFVLLGLRMIGANLLHTISSGIIGYFLARGLFLKERFSLVKGFIGATAIHALFNWLVLQVSKEAPYYIYFVIFLLIIGFLIILRDFYKLKPYDE